MKLRSAADSFKPAAGETPSDAPKPSAGRGKGRGRGRGGRGRGRKAKRSDEEEDQEDAGTDADLDQEDERVEQELEAEEGPGEDGKTPKKPTRSRRSTRTPKTKSKNPKSKRTPKLKRALRAATAESVTLLHLLKARTTNPLQAHRISTYQVISLGVRQGWARDQRTPGGQPCLSFRICFNVFIASEGSETFTISIRVKVVEKFRDGAKKEIQDPRFIVPFELSNVKPLGWFIIFAPKRFPPNLVCKACVWPLRSFTLPALSPKGPSIGVLFLANF